MAEAPAALSVGPSNQTFADESESAARIPARSDALVCASQHASKGRRSASIAAATARQILLFAAAPASG